MRVAELRVKQKSSGRGGAGNIHSASVRDDHTYIDSLPVRGREASPAGVRTYSVSGPHPSHLHNLSLRFRYDIETDMNVVQGIAFTGRGGAGNFREDSRGPVQRDEKEDTLLRAASETHPPVVRYLRPPTLVLSDLLLPALFRSRWRR
jgi:hypothetical protein